MNSLLKRFISSSLSKCIRNKRFVIKKCEIAVQKAAAVRTEVTTAELIAPPAAIPIIQQILEKDHDHFIEAFEEFNPKFQDDDQLLIKEFEESAKFKDFPKKLKASFNKASKIFKISVTAELEDDAYIQIFNKIEKSVTRTSMMILKVNINKFCKKIKI